MCSVGCGICNIESVGHRKRSALLSGLMSPAAGPESAAKNWVSMMPTARLIAHVMGAPLCYLYCEDDKVAALLLALHQMKPAARDSKVAEWLG